jgi:hypothetical protein
MPSHGSFFWHVNCWQGPSPWQGFLEGWHVSDFPQAFEAAHVTGMHVPSLHSLPFAHTIVLHLSGHTSLSQPTTHPSAFFFMVQSQPGGGAAHPGI